MKKKISVMLIALLAISIVSAVLVTYLSNTVSESITVESPILLEETEFDLENQIGTAGEDGFMLVKIENLADSDITGDFEIAISPDAAGISIAVGEDINYVLKAKEI